MINSYNYIEMGNTKISGFLLLQLSFQKAAAVTYSESGFRALHAFCSAVYSWHFGKKKKNF